MDLPVGVDADLVARNGFEQQRELVEGGAGQLDVGVAVLLGDLFGDLVEGVGVGGRQVQPGVSVDEWRAVSVEPRFESGGGLEPVEVTLGQMPAGLGGVAGLVAGRGDPGADVPARGSVVHDAPPGADLDVLVQPLVEAQPRRTWWPLELRGHPGDGQGRVVADVPFRADGLHEVAPAVQLAVDERGNLARTPGAGADRQRAKGLAASHGVGDQPSEFVGVCRPRGERARLEWPADLGSGAAPTLAFGCSDDMVRDPGSGFDLAEQDGEPTTQ